MSRYIDADAVKNPYGGTSLEWQGILLLKLLDEAPSIDLDDYVPKDFHDKTCEAMAKAHQEEIADMVRVVQCKECRYWNTKGCRDGVGECEWAYYMTKPDDFCSYGQKGDENVETD